MTSDPALAGYESVGSRQDLDGFLDEYGLTEHDLQGKIAVRTPLGVGGMPRPQEYLVHESILRSCGEFPCAGDTNALRFCREVTDEMVAALGIDREEAIARINRQWSEPGDDGRTPRVWIVGLDIVYHEDEHFWARTIYYGHDSCWWNPGTTPEPLPPPQ
jgi:hypothetical protein